jgi:hypothetical protein
LRIFVLRINRRDLSSTADSPMPVHAQIGRKASSRPRASDTRQARDSKHRLHFARRPGKVHQRDGEVIFRAST